MTIADTVTFEELRKIVLQALNKYREAGANHLQFGGFSSEVAHELLDIQGRLKNPGHVTVHYGFGLSSENQRHFLQLFWQFFREGIISLGSDIENPQFPFFHLTEKGNASLDGAGTFDFYNEDSYIKRIKNEVPNLPNSAEVYLREAVLAFYNDLLHSAAVMLGVALEADLEELFSAILAGSNAPVFSKISKERTILNKFNEFQKLLNSHLNLLSAATKEDLNTHLGPIFAVIRVSRNESGHPTGKTVNRDQLFVYFQIIMACFKKIAQIKIDLQ